MTQPVTLADRVRYGMVALPLAFAGVPLYIHAPDFYVTQHGISLATIGLVLLGLRFFDAIQDPIIGHVSDHFATHRMKLLLPSALLLVVAFGMLFQPPAATLGWFVVSMVLATSAYSILSINLNSIGGLWSEDYHHKTSITSTREAFGLIGLLIAVILPTALQQFVSPTQAFAGVAGMLALFMLLAMLLFIPWYRAHRTIIERHASQESTDSRLRWREIPPATRRFFAIYGVSMLASSMPAVLILFFVRDRLDAESLTGLFLAIYFVAGAAALPFWQWLSKRTHKGQAWLCAMLVQILSFVWAFLLGTGDVTPFAIICLLSGMAFGADLALPPSILADLVQAHKQERASSFQFSLLAFLLKSSVAIASASVFILLDFAGLKPGEANDSSALWWLSASYALIPSIIKIFSAGMLYRGLSHFSTGGPHDKDDKKNANPTRSIAHAN
jgi:Na+/melibiose symporter-like transporter